METQHSRNRRILIVMAVAVVALVLSTSLAVGLYGVPMMWNRANGNGSNGTSTTSSSMTMEQAVQDFKNYVGTLGNSNIALHEVEQYQYNFYASYYEKDTGTFAFQMVIWKQGSGYMMGMMGYYGATGVAVPEIGPNMMWNTKYHVSGGMMSTGTTSGMMGGSGGMMGGNSYGASTPMTVSKTHAWTNAQQYLNNSLPGKTAGDVDTYYGYYNIDVLVNGSTFGMISVNGYTGQVWYHTWHGTYVGVTVS